MKEYLEMKKEFGSLLERGVLETKKLGYPAQSEALSEIKDRLDKKELLIVTIGEMKRGKSSLLEALTEEMDVFPIDLNVCTNVVTILKYGPKEKFEVVLDSYSDDGTVESNVILIDRTQIMDFVSEQHNKGNEKNVRCLCVELPNDKLKSGLVFVDTPGVGSLNIAHAEITYGFLPEADVVLFVTDAAAGLTETELKFLEAAYKHCKNIIFPITKTDIHADYGEILESNKEKINACIGLPKEKIIMLPVSSTAKRRYLKTGNEELYLASNYKTLEQIIWKTVAEKRAQIIIMPFLAEMSAQLNKIKAEINLQYQALGQDKAVSYGITTKLNQLIDERKRLQKDGTQWRRTINSELQQLATKVNNLINIELRPSLIDYIDGSITVSGMTNSSVSRRRREEMLHEINTTIIETTFNIKQLLLRDVEDLCDNIYRELNLNVDFDEAVVEDLDYEPTGQLELHKPKLNMLEKAMTIGGGATFGSMRGAMGGSIYGGLAGGIIGGLVGLLGGPAGVMAGAKAGIAIGGSIGTGIGTFKGVSDAQKTIDGESAADIKKALTTYVSKNIAILQAAVTNIIQKLALTIPQNFENELSEKIELSSQTSAAIQADAKLNQEEVLQRQNEVKAKAAVLNSIESEMVKIAKEIKGE